jgi:hypothetical protein
MPVKLNSTGGGSVTLDVGSTASNFTQTLPSATTTIVGTDTTQTLTNKTIGSGYGGGVITEGTAVSLSGTAVDFTGIPSWAKKITVMLNGISTNGTSAYTIRLGTGSTTYATTGYAGFCGFTSGVSSSSFSTAFVISVLSGAASLGYGAITLQRLSGNTWVETSTLGIPAGDNTGTSVGGGTVTLSDTLTAIRITTASGTQTFDAGTINIQYEG